MLISWISKTNEWESQEFMQVVIDTLQYKVKNYVRIKKAASYSYTILLFSYSFLQVNLRVLYSCVFSLNYEANTDLRKNAATAVEKGRSVSLLIQKE